MRARAAAGQNEQVPREALTRRNSGFILDVVTDDRVPGVERSRTGRYRCTLCTDVELNGNDGPPSCSNESWHPMEPAPEVDGETNQ